MNNFWYLVRTNSRRLSGRRFFPAVLSLRRKRNDDRKYVCCSQATQGQEAGGSFDYDKSPRGILPYISYMGMCPPHQVGFLHRFDLKSGIHFAHFGLESGMVFEGTTGVCERIYRFNPKWVRKKEKYANSKWIWRIFCLRSNPSNDNIISAKRPGLKTGMDFRGPVWKRVWKITFFLVWNWVRNWRTGRHTLTMNSYEKPPRDKR